VIGRLRTAIGRFACWLAGKCDWKTRTDDRGYLRAECTRCGNTMTFDQPEVDA
jgi:hypothetical protein